MIKNKLKLAGIRLVVSAMLVVAPLIALGGISYADGTVNWTGQGADSVKACSSGQTPFLHWIFTTGGNSSVASATLTVSGNASGGGAMSQHGGSWTIDTAYSGTGQPTTSTVSAHVSFTGSLGNGTANLVISDGCFGSGGQGGGGGNGGGNNNNGGNNNAQVLGTTTQTQAPAGGVGAGLGGEASTLSTGAAIGLGGSLLTIGSGLALLNRRKV